MNAWAPSVLAAAGIIVSLALGLTALKRGASDRANLNSAKDTADLSKQRADELQASLEREKERFAEHVLQATRERHADQLRCAEDIAVLSGKVELLTSAWVDDVSRKLVETFEATIGRLMPPSATTTTTSSTTEQTSTTEVTP